MRIGPVCAGPVNRGLRMWSGNVSKLPGSGEYVTMVLSDRIR